jgi:hypothetical protein
MQLSANVNIKLLTCDIVSDILRPEGNSEVDRKTGNAAMTYEEVSRYYYAMNELANKQTYGDRALFINKYSDYVCLHRSFPNEIELSRGMKVTQTGTPASTTKWAIKIAVRLQELFYKANGRV